MKNHVFARGGALFLVPMVVASCGGTSIDSTPVLPSMAENTANKDLPGCTIGGESCNPTVSSGVVTKVDGTTESAEIRFVTFTDNLDDTYTYDDGERQLILQVTDIYGGVVYLEGPDGIFILEQTTNTYSVAGWAFTFDPDEFYLGVVGSHTDASAIPLDGTADYVGSGFIIATSGEADVSSTLTVDFGAGSADLVADTLPEENSIVGFDSMESRNMTIDGYTFYGDEVVLLNGINEVNVTGANTEAAGAGLFYGPTTDGNPSEFGAIATVIGDDGAVLLVTEGQLAAP